MSANNYLILSLSFLLTSTSVIAMETAPQTSSKGPAGSASASVYNVPRNQRNSSCYVSYSGVQSLKEKDRPLLFVDVRPDSEYRKYRIPESIRLDLNSVKAKQFLQTSHLILINQGVSYKLLEDECLKLQDLNFEVEILLGGLNSWHDQGGELEGDPFEIEKLSYVDSRDFFLDSIYDDWLTIDFTSDQSKAKEFFSPTLRKTKDGANFKSEEIKKYFSGRGTDTLPFILVLTDNGDIPVTLRRQFTDAAIRNVYYLRGGLAAYNSFLVDQDMMRSPYEINRKSCKTCP